MWEIHLQNGDFGCQGAHTYTHAGAVAEPRAWTSQVLAEGHLRLVDQEAPGTGDAKKSKPQS